MLVLLAACSGDDGTPLPVADVVPRDVSASVVPSMPTVVTVTWTTADPSTGHVDFAGRSTPETPEGTEHQVTLIGLPPDTQLDFVVVSGAESADGSIATGGLPVAPPTATVTGSGNDRFTLLPLLGDPNRIVLLDPQGQVTWIYEDPRGLELFRARIAVAGDGIWYLSSVVAGGPAPDSALVKVGWDGTVLDEIVVPDLAHDFVELPDGTLAALTYETRDEVLGNAVIEIAPDRTTTTVWSSWDCFDPAVHQSDDPAQGWTHANALDYEAEDDLYLVGMRNLSTIAAVDRQSGGCPWAFGGEGGDVDVSGEDFEHEHQFERIPGGLLVFDNDGASGQVSRVVEYTFDEAAKTAQSVREIVADPPLYSFILGDVHRTEDGDTLIVWATPAKIDRVAPDGTLKWRVDMPGAPLGFAHWLADPYVVE